MENGFHEPSTDDAENIIKVLDGKAAVIFMTKLPIKYKVLGYITEVLPA